MSAAVDITKFVVRASGRPPQAGGASRGQSGALKRNDTAFPVRMTAKLRDLHEHYLKARADTSDPGHGWASVLKYYQYLVRTIMSDPEYGIGADGNARGLLVYHTMGLGKTRLAVATAMSMWDVRPPVVLLARGLQKNFLETVDTVVEALNPGVPRPELTAKQAAARAKFHMVSMDAYNAADQMARAGTGASRVKRGDIAGATGGLDGKLLIVDEAHNFFRAIINSSAENANGRRLYDMIMTARNLRILFLTGTPPAKDPFELVPCFNMLNGSDLLPTQYEIFYKLYVDKARRTVRNRAHLANRLAGLVSHVTHARPSEPAVGEKITTIASALVSAGRQQLLVSFARAGKPTAPSRLVPPAGCGPKPTSPSLLWLSSAASSEDRGASWFDWTREEMPAVFAAMADQNLYGYRVAPDRIARVDSERALAEFTEKYGCSDRVGRPAIDWGRVAADYAGAAFDPYRPKWAGPQTAANPRAWYLSLDVVTWVVWDGAAVETQVELRAPPAGKKPRDDGWFPEGKPVIVETVEMGADQYRAYLLAREKEEAEGRGGEGAGGRGAGVLAAPPLALPGSEKKAMRSYYVKSRSLSNFAPPREWAGSPVDAMPAEVFTAAVAPKLALIAERADKAPGPVLAYSQFVDAGGLRPLGRFLQRLGYAPYVPDAAEIAKAAARPAKKKAPQPVEGVVPTAPEPAPAEEGEAAPAEEGEAAPAEEEAAPTGEVLPRGSGTSTRSVGGSAADSAVTARGSLHAGDMEYSWRVYSLPELFVAPEDLRIALVHVIRFHRGGEGHLAALEQLADEEPGREQRVIVLVAGPPDSADVAAIARIAFASDKGRVSMVHTAMPHRGRGLCKVVVGNLVRAVPLPAYSLEVEATNAPAIACYRSVGFRPVGPDPDHPEDIIMEMRHAAPREKNSPPLVIEPHRVDGKTLNVVRDDLLFAGTKQRAAADFVSELLRDRPGTTTLMYTAPFNGFGPVAAAHAAKELGLKCHLILLRRGFGTAVASTPAEVEGSETVKRARELGASVEFVDTWKALAAAGTRYEGSDPGVLWLPLGFLDPRFSRVLAERVRRAAPAGFAPSRVWVAGGAGALALALARAFPDAEIRVVPASLEPRVLGRIRDYVVDAPWVSVLDAHPPTAGPPPYPTVAGYDSRAWDAAVALGEDGDVVWNAGRGTVLGGSAGEGGAEVSLVPLADSSPAQRAALAAIGSDPEVYKHIGAGRPWDAAHIAGVYAQAVREAAGPSDYYDWLVLAADREGPAVVGYVGFRPVPRGVKDARRGDFQIRYFIAPARRGRGLAVAAGRLATEVLARAAGGTRVWALIPPENAGSIRVAEKLGFARVGAARVGNRSVEAYRRRTPAAPVRRAPAVPAAPVRRAPAVPARRATQPPRRATQPPRRAEVAAAADRDVPVDFPFRRLYMPTPYEMYKRLEAIAARPPAEWESAAVAPRLALVRRTFPGDFDSTDSLTDHFVEPVRAACRERGEPAPAAAWRAIKSRAEAEGRALPADARERRELVYAAARGCNLFNNALAVYLLSRFGARDVLDCTAGWGDRLVAAHVVGARTYRGWDTNPALQPVYAAIASHNALGELGKPGAPPLDWAVELGQFEAAAPRFEPGGDMVGRFDTALFCPPYFDKEVYQGPGTSSEAHPTLDRWYREFYRPAVRAAAAGLRPGGHLLAYVTDGRMREEIDAVLKGTSFEYIGAVGFQQVVERPGQAPQEGRVRDTFVWRRAGASGPAAEPSKRKRTAGGGQPEGVSIVSLPAASPLQLRALARVAATGSESQRRTFIGSLRRAFSDLNHLRHLATSEREPRDYNWLVLSDDAVVGAVGLHDTPSTTHRGLSFWSFFEKPRRAWDTEARRAAIVNTSGRAPSDVDLWEFVRPTDAAAVRAAETLGYREAGRVPWTGAQSRVVYHRRLRSTVGEAGAVSRQKGGGAGAGHPKGHYAVISGEVPSEVRDAIKRAFNSPANAHGEVIKAILVSKTGAEGLDLKYLRETHQIEPYWDKARDEQVKSRAVRIGSHDGLPREEREVQPYLYIAAANKKIWGQMLERDREARTIDQQFADRASERFEINSAFRQLLAEICLECGLFGYGSCRSCVPTGAPLFHDDPALDARLPDPCEIRRESEVKASPVQLGTVTYYYIADPASPVGYTFYALREDLGGYAPLDPADPLIPDLLRAIGQAPRGPEPAEDAEDVAGATGGGRKDRRVCPPDVLDPDGLEAFAAAIGWCDLEPSDCGP